MHRQIVESELHACTLELNYLQSEMAAAEVSARGIVYDKLTECEKILSKIPLLRDDYLNMIDFKSQFLPGRQRSTPITERNSGSMNDSTVAAIKSRTYAAILPILRECEGILYVIPRLSEYYTRVRLLRLHFIEGVRN